MLKCYNYKKLRLRIIEKFDTQKNFAKALGKQEGYVTRYLTNSTTFTQAIIAEWCELLGIASEEIGEYFFCLED